MKHDLLKVKVSACPPNVMSLGGNVFFFFRVCELQLDDFVSWV